MDDDPEEPTPSESSFLSRQSASRQNEQANEEGQFLWSLYRKHASSTDSDRDSDGSEVTSDGSVQWEKNFIDKLVKVKKHSCLQERTAPASEGTTSWPENHEPSVSQRLSPHVEPNNCQLNSSEEGTPKLNEDTTSSPESRELPLSQRLNSHVEPNNGQLNSSGEQTPKLNEGIIGSPTNSQVSSKCDSGTMKVSFMSCLHEYDDTRQKLHNVNHQFGDFNKCDISGVSEQLPECSRNCDSSSSRGSSQLRREKEVRRDIRTTDHTCGELNLGYVSRWEKKSPGAPKRCEISSSSTDSESDDEHERRRERQNQAGTPESEKIVESPRNGQVLSSCESDSGDSGYSNLCLRVSEDSMEDDTDHSSGRDKRNKLHETSADKEDALPISRHKLFQSVESVKNDFCVEVPTREDSLSPHMKKKRSISHPRQQTNNAQLYSNIPAQRLQQWTRDSLYRGRCGRLRSQSPTDKVGRWRRSQSPVEPCRKLRSRSVLPIRDTQCVTWRKRRSKSCETVRRYKKLNDSQQPSEECVPFGGTESVSEAPSNNGVKRQSRSRRRRWSKSVSLPGRHKTPSSSRNKSMVQEQCANSGSLPVGMAARCILCNCSPKSQEKRSVPASKYALLTKSKSHVNQTHQSKTWNESEGQLTPRMRRSLSRSSIVSDTAQKESVTESIPTKLRRSMSEVCLYSSKKQESLERGREHMTRQSGFVNTSERNKRTSKKKESLKELGSTTFLHSAQADASRTNKHSRISEEELSSSTSMHSAPVTTPRRQSRLNKFLEIKDKSTFTNTHALLIKSCEEVLLNKGKKITDNHIVDSSCSVSGRIAKRHTKSGKSQELAGDSLQKEEFKGFPEEELPSNTSLSLPEIASESCDYLVSTETLHRVHSKRKSIHSGSVFTNGTFLTQNKVKMTSELLGLSDGKHLLHCSSRKRKLPHEDSLSQDKLLTSRRLSSLLSGSGGKEAESYISEGRSVEKHPSPKRSLLRTSAGCESQEYNSNSHLQLSHSSAVNVHATVNETPHPPSKGKFHNKSSRTNSSLFKCANAVYDAAASDTKTVKCSPQERIYCKEDNVLPGISKSFIKPCSVVLKNLVLSSGYNKYVNKNEKFVFPPFPRVASLTRVCDFCLPEDYMNTVGKKASELI